MKFKLSTDLLVSLNSNRRLTILQEHFPSLMKWVFSAEVPIYFLPWLLCVGPLRPLLRRLKIWCAGFAVADEVGRDERVGRVGLRVPVREIFGRSTHFWRRRKYWRFTIGRSVRSFVTRLLSLYLSTSWLIRNLKFDFELLRIRVTGFGQI